MGKKRQRDDTEEVQEKLVKKKCKAVKAKRSSSETFEQKLARSDPDFLEYLKSEKSDLLEFDDGELSADSDDNNGAAQQEDMDDDDDEDEDDDGDDLPKAKKTSLKKRADDEADENDDEVGERQSRQTSTKKTVVTLKMVQHWTKQLTEKNSIPVMVELIGAFKAALQQVGNTDDMSSKFKVVGSEVFNAVVQACLQEIVPLLLRILKLPESKDPNKPVLPSISPRWKQVRQEVKSYISDVIILVSCVGSVDVVRALLKHLLDLVVFAVGFPKLSKTLLKKLIEVWSSSGNESNTLLSFCSIHRLLRLSREMLFDVGFKLMYTGYVRNTKFTSPTTLSMIQVMQRTLVEVGRLNVEGTYKYAFTYIRQLAIHLRTAMTVKKKEMTQIVYNWQYLHSLSLWTRLICELNLDEYIHSLLYPLTQIIIGTIKLVPTAQFYPLRFLCIRQLNKLSAVTSTFIPVLPFLTEVLNELDFHRPVRGSNMQSYNFLCILKLSKSELNSKAFRDGVIDQLNELMLDNLNIYAHTIGFPELCLPVVLELRKFLKSCKVPSYTRTIKDLLAKVTETSAVITERRRNATLNIRDLSAVTAWESSSLQAGTPLTKFYATWKKLRDQQMKAELLQSGQQPSKNSAKKNKKDKKTDNSEFNEEELELLAQSASEDDDEADEDDDDDDDSGSDEEDSDNDDSNRNTKQNKLKANNNVPKNKASSSKSADRNESKIGNNIEDSDESDVDAEDDVVENISLSDSDDGGGGERISASRDDDDDDDDEDDEDDDDEDEDDDE